MKKPIEETVNNSKDLLLICSTAVIIAVSTNCICAYIVELCSVKWICLVIGLFLLFNNKGIENNSKSDYYVQKTETISNNTSVSTVKNENKSNTPPVETEITSFSTKIITKDSARQKNISITCSTLNDTLVENGKTFSFCDTVGQATTAKGYQKADIFDAKR